MLDYRINTFLTLYREMNYRRTAESLNMTQHIQYLEKAYGTRLFRYDGRQLTRTPSAELLKRSVERMLAEEQALETAFREPHEFRLRVGATKTIGEFVILPMAAAFAAKEDNRLELVIDNTEVLLNHLEEGQLDFALIEGTFDKNKFDFHLFQAEQFVGVCSKDHPFAGQCVPLEEIFKERLIVREPGSGTRNILEQLLMDRSYTLDSFRKIMTVNNFAAIRHLAAQGLGITFAYRPVVESDHRLAAFQLEDIQVVREFNYVYLNRHIAQEQIRRFQEG